VLLMMRHFGVRKNFSAIFSMRRKRGRQNLFRKPLKNTFSKRAGAECFKNKSKTLSRGYFLFGIQSLT